MPFYLVTHTALVEADDEVGAAEKVLAKLQADTQVAFTVKFDETSIKQVSVPNEADQKRLKHNSGLRSNSQVDLKNNIAHVKCEMDQVSKKGIRARKGPVMVEFAVLFVAIGVFIVMKCDEMILNLLQ